MGKPAIFLDRDGTLIEDRGPRSDPAQVLFYPGLEGALRRLGGAFEFFIVVPRNGAAGGRVRPEDARRVNDAVVERLAGAGVPVRGVYCGPPRRADGCGGVEPNPHFLFRARDEHGVDLSRSWVVGDHPADMELAAAAGARGVYVLTGHGEKHRTELKVSCAVVPSLVEAAEEIARVHAARVLREGGLVAFPTETVYGLGADATHEAAVRRIFAVKGRPAGHPLIVHLASAEELGEWAAEVPREARILSERFWPGPLTIVLRRGERVSRVVTGGQETVGLRVPAHPAARALLREFGGGVAAPSANRFGRVSPTTADHVRQDLGEDVDFILDGGPCTVGIESTIVDLSGEAPALLRPGGVPREALEAALGRPVPPAGSGGPRAPGRLASHYAPRARVILAEPGTLEARAAELRARGVRVEILRLPEDGEAAARMLYAALRAADARGVEAVVAAAPSEEGLGLAIADRLRKAAGGRSETEQLPSPEERS
ncbi:MAG TPA: L-threonylcarbamoyladenylate synthase [Planctomycetota bacterium]|nr:L-threonylcarbamoyladenylate synthase [Planctomycetota bacterium]